MKKIVLALFLNVSLLMSTEAIFGEFGTPKEEKLVMFSADVGLWYISWEQTSTSSDFLQTSSDALDTAYNIDKAPAAVLELNFNYDFVSANAEYFNSDGASGLGFDVSLIELIPFINLELRYVKADFEGEYSYSGFNDTSLNGKAKFESPLEIIDIIIYPVNKYIGVGYRTYNYEMPQDFYLINNTTGSQVVVGGENGGLSDMQYKGSFYTIVLDNKKEINSRRNYNGLVYSAICGMGELTPKNLTYSSLDVYTTDLDATFYDIQIGYSMKEQSDGGFGYGVGAGYRYNKIDTTANKASNADNYSLMTEFNTEFHGPYVDVSISF